MKGLDKASGYHRLAVDSEGKELPAGARLSGATLENLIKRLKVSSEVVLHSIGVLLDMPGGRKGYLEIDKTKEKHCETVLRMIAKRVRSH